VTIRHVAPVCRRRGSLEAGASPADGRARALSTALAVQGGCRWLSVSTKHAGSSSPVPRVFVPGRRA